MKPLISWKRITIGLHARLILWLLALLGTLWVVLWSNTTSTVKDTASQDIDQRLKTTATLLLGLYTRQAPDKASRDQAPAIEPSRGVVLTIPSTLGRETPLSFEIISLDTGILATTPDFPGAARDSSPGFEDRTIEDQQWRIFTLADRRQRLVSRAAILQSNGTTRADNLQRDFASPLIWLLPVFAMLAVFSVWRGLAPLRRLEKAIAVQDPLAPSPLDIDPAQVPSELRPLIITLDRLMQKVKEVLTRQRAFTAAAGHELRTPLAGCRAQLQVARRSQDVDKRQGAIDKAQHSVDHMSALVEQLLLLARLDPAAPPPDMEPLDLGHLVRQIVDNVVASNPDIRFRMQGIDRPLFVQGNPTLLDTLIANLLTNAIRFSLPQGRVDVSLARQCDQAIIRVIDQGPGIPLKERDKVFDPFYHCERDASGKSGNGLGLAIVQAVANAHGGWAEVVAPDEGGTEFRIYLPLAISTV
ncbi:MAG: HAMP domain-containing sensor histidine kinase [Halomonas sp.]|uniref:sensor histidine kinase n=1 Tax=Halomonas sp. TaxID=1486246 RepID=UPI002ACE3C11|nr:HAMP domain-containing sensor histidine kinase [Halomonas sp.]MDZ7851758.1 HAMP domain-containing sensor histidine kinase [Halomonas sp.]